MSSDIKVILAPTFEIAQAIDEELDVLLTVEAEYGANVAEGRLYTAAHHQPGMEGRPAPCNDRKIPRLHRRGYGTILISHIDLDTIGGVLRALCDGAEFLDIFGVAHITRPFWRAAQYVDLNGPHRAHEEPAWFQDQTASLMTAYWAWSQDRPRFPRDVATDVTEEVWEHARVLTALLADPMNLDDEELALRELLIAGGIARQQQKQVVNRESLRRVADSPLGTILLREADTFVSAMYDYEVDGNLGAAKAVVAYNPKLGTVTVSHDGAPFSARDFVQDLWGPEAGGHNGIAGSPRGKVMTFADAEEAFAKLVALRSEKPARESAAYTTAAPLLLLLKKAEERDPALPVHLLVSKEHTVLLAHRAVYERQRRFAEDAIHVIDITRAVRSALDQMMPGWRVLDVSALGLPRELWCTFASNSKEEWVEWLTSHGVDRDRAIEFVDEDW